MAPALEHAEILELHINAINLEKYVAGSAPPKMNQAKINSFPIALPPFAEQCRIVAKVDQPIALVDTLDAQLTAARAPADHLLTALVAAATNAASPHPYGSPDPNSQ